jgi:Ser-tRNA(Ala) deacylase AlaX
MQIGNFLPVPCGGTHLSSTSEIGDTAIPGKNSNLGKM